MVRLHSSDGYTMFDRQRSSKPQLQRKVASKTREQLENDASQKEVCILVTCSSLHGVW